MDTTNLEGLDQKTIEQLRAVSIDVVRRCDAMLTNIDPQHKPIIPNRDDYRAFLHWRNNQRRQRTLT